MKQKLKQFCIFWFFIGIVGLECSLISCSIDTNYYSILFSFLLVFPFVFISSFLTLYVGYQIPKWASKLKNWKSKILWLTIVLYILISIVGFIPIIIVIIFISIQNIVILSNGNAWPFNFIGLIVFYITYLFCNIGFLIFQYRPQKKLKTC